MTEDEMVGWYHRLNGHESEQMLGDGEGQGRPGMLQSMGSQRVGHDLVTENKYFSISRPLREAWRGSNPEIRCSGSFILEALTCLNILNSHYPHTVQGH